jgi:hypothetical protein
MIPLPQRYSFLKNLVLDYETPKSYLTRASSLKGWLWNKWNYICPKAHSREVGFALFGIILRNGGCVCNGVCEYFSTQ